MDHNDIRHKLSEYIDGTITAEERTAIEAHLPSCADCSEALRELRKTIEHLQAIEEIEPPAWMTQRIMARVRHEEQRRTSKRALREFFLILRPVRVLAVLALTVTVYYIYLNLGPVEKVADSPERTLSKQPPVESSELTNGQVADESSIRRRTGPGPAAGRTTPAPGEHLAQSPEYRSLDMKYSYEQPAPPEPASPPAADAQRLMAPKQEVPAGSEETARSIAVAPQAAAPLSEQRMEKGVRAEAEAPAEAAVTSAAVIRYSLVAEAVTEATARAAQAITAVGGKVQRTDTAPLATVLRATVPADAMPKLQKALQQIGTLLEKTDPPAPRSELATVEITIRRSVPAP